MWIGSSQDLVKIRKFYHEKLNNSLVLGEVARGQVCNAWNEKAVNQRTVII